MYYNLMVDTGIFNPFCFAIVPIHAAPQSVMSCCTMQWYFIFFNLPLLFICIYFYINIFYLMLNNLTTPYKRGLSNIK